MLEKHETDGSGLEMAIKQIYALAFDLLALGEPEARLEVGQDGNRLAITYTGFAGTVAISDDMRLILQRDGVLVYDSRDRAATDRKVANGVAMRIAGEMLTLYEQLVMRRIKG